MRRKIFALVGLVICIVGALVVFWPSDERRIRTLFKEGIEAVESENVEALMSKVSLNYRDDRGLTYLTLREWLKREFQVFTEIDVDEGELSVAISGDQATADLRVRVLATEGSMRGYVVGGPKELASLSFALAKERSRWLVTRCRWPDPQRP